MRKVMAIDPANIDVLYYVGLAEQKAGHLDRARALWNKVLAAAPATDPLAIAIHNRLDTIAVEKKNDGWPLSRNRMLKPRQFRSHLKFRRMAVSANPLANVFGNAP